VSAYTPELGQAVFGQPTQQLKPDWREDALLEILMNAWSIFGDENANPFGNYGRRYDGKAFRAHSYSWDEDEHQEWNFAWRDFRASWYKWCGRGVSVNRHLSADEAREALRECFAEIAEAKP
jgi:hypothetical protein